MIIERDYPDTVSFDEDALKDKDNSWGIITK